jgi:hypothetical protein
LFDDEIDHIEDDIDSDHDDLDDLIAEITKENPNFPAMLEAALQERLAMIARGEDPNDIPWDDEEAEGHEASTAQPATPLQT